MWVLWRSRGVRLPVSARVRRWYVVGRRAGAVASDAGVLEFRVGGVGPVQFWGRCFAGAV